MTGRWSDNERDPSNPNGPGNQSNGVLSQALADMLETVAVKWTPLSAGGRSSQSETPNEAQPQVRFSW